MEGYPCASCTAGAVHRSSIMVVPGAIESVYGIVASSLPSACEEKGELRS